MPKTIILAPPHAQSGPVLDQVAEKTIWVHSNAWLDLYESLSYPSAAGMPIPGPNEIAFVKITFVTHAEVE